MGKWVVVSDSHNDCNGSLKPIIEAAMADGATQVIHCGDIDPINWNAESFCGLPVAVALTDGQVGDDRYRRELVPDNWQITVPGNRVISVFVHLIYLGHKIGWDCLTKSIREVQQKIDLHRKERDALRHMFTGHSHQQFLLRDDLIDLINPGETLGKYQYALMDPDTGEITFTRLPFEPIPRSTVTKVAVIADTEKIAGIDSRFWATFAAALKEHGIRQIIHCGGFDTADIGRAELNDFQVFAYFKKDQFVSPEKMPANWHRLGGEHHLVKIDDYQCYVDYYLSEELFKDSGFDLNLFSQHFNREHPEVNFVLCGGTYITIYEEGGVMNFLDPGDAVRSRSWVEIEFPRMSVTFHRLPRPAPSKPYAD